MLLSLYLFVEIRQDELRVRDALDCLAAFLPERAILCQSPIYVWSPKACKKYLLPEFSCPNMCFDFSEAYFINNKI
jgi:hypothetical protein